jgi:glycosyltransferase involved in cell wall biosynthesis
MKNYIVCYRDSGMETFKVLHLIDSGGLYGAEKVVLTLLDELRGSAFPGVLGCICENEAEPPLIAKKAEENGIPVQYFAMDRGLNLAGLRSIRRFIQSHDIRLVHSHGYKPNIFLSFILGKRFKAVSTVHGWAKQAAGVKERFYELLDSMALRRMDRVIAVSRAVQNDLVRRGVRDKRIDLIYNGLKIVNDRPYLASEPLRRKFGIPGNAFVIGSVGRLVKVKGHSFLIEAMPSILDEVKNCWLIIVGDGPLKGDLEALISERGLSRNVKLTGYISDIHEFMSVIDLFALPSLSEGLPISLLEAMACEKPVLASRVGGIPEVITSPDEGVLVPPADPQAISQAIRRLARDRNKLGMLSVRSKNLIENRFSSFCMATQYSNVYAGLMNSRSGRNRLKEEVKQERGRREGL